MNLLISLLGTKELSKILSSRTCDAFAGIAYMVMAVYTFTIHQKEGKVRLDTTARK